jgi:pyruvate, water dikinase
MIDTRPKVPRWLLGILAVAPFVLCSCGGADEGGADITLRTDFGVWVEGECVVPDGEEPDYAQGIGCESDFKSLASQPLDESIPGATSSKTVIDTVYDNELYFIRAEKYPMHWHFANEHLSVQAGKPPVGDMGTFSQEYDSPYRRFLLGAITFYEEPGVWTYEIAPYDTASAEMIQQAFDIIKEEVYFGDHLFFHPTSDRIESLLPDLPDHIKVITTDELFAGVTFLPLNLGTGIGRLRILQTADLESGEVFVTPRDIVVLDKIPVDIAVVAAIITEELQTPLSHINVLSQNRGTPNMSLVGATKNSDVKALDGKWVELTVDPFNFELKEISKAAADAWWDEHKPPAVKIAQLDLSVKDLRDAEEIFVTDIPAFGGKASHYGELTRIGEAVPVPKAFAVPLYWYKHFEQQNGIDVMVDGLLDDPEFQSSIEYREKTLKELRKLIRKGAIDPEFEIMLMLKLEADFPGVRMRFRSSTNAEDLDGFTGAGLYTSKTGDPSDPQRPVLDAVRSVYASLWNFRAFEEREFRSIDHRGVGMALLCHRSFPNEDANGVALTNNIFDITQPAFYINIQAGDASVVKPPPGITTDQFLYFFYYPNQPTVFFGHSSLVPEGETVLTPEQTYTLGQALSAIHKNFASMYQKGANFYAMDVEFKFNTDPGEEESSLWVKQARPHPGWAVGTK